MVLSGGKIDSWHSQPHSDLSQDHWQCETCHTFNVPFYRNCSKCWSLRPHWLPESSLPSSSSTSSAPLPAEPSGSQHGYYAQSSNDDQPGSSQGYLQQWRAGDKVRRRRIRVVSASSSERSSESLASLSEDEPPSTSTSSAAAQKDNCSNSSVTLTSSQGQQSSQEGQGEGSVSQGSAQSASAADARGRGGGKWRRNDGVAPSADMCMVCASRPKTGCIIHGRSGHQVCCYRCAKRMLRKGLPCPWCRRPIQKVIKNFVLWNSQSD